MCESNNSNIYDISNNSETYNIEDSNVVILQHGLFDSSFTWLLLGSSSLPFLLSSAGSDVWITNSRGNAFSYGHKNRSSSSSVYERLKIWGGENEKYWDFSFHEMALYDLPGIIKYIKVKTGKEKVDYVAHSQGGLIFLVLHSLNKKILEDSISHFVWLGTVIGTKHTDSNLLKLCSLSNLSKLLDKLRINNILCFDEFYYDIIRLLCLSFDSHCLSVVNFIVSNSVDTGRINKTRLFSDFLYVPAGTSAKNLRHWLQLFSSGNLSMFDYGEEKNEKIYGKKKPNEYNISSLLHSKIRMLFFSGDRDPFMKAEDIERVERVINKDFARVVRLKNYNHLDYLWSEDARRDIYGSVEEFLDE